MNRPLVALSTESMTMLKVNALHQKKNLSEYLAELILIGYQQQKFRGIQLLQIESEIGC